MSGALIVFIVIMALEFVAMFGSMTFGIVRDKKAAKAGEVVPCEECAEEKAEEVAVCECEEAQDEIEETIEIEDDADEGDEESEEDGEDGEVSATVGSKKRVPFAEKILAMDDKTKEYFNTIHNKFKGLRKINPRVSSKGVSYRLGRELVAKLTIRGKTLKLHLALDAGAFDSKKFFHKDLGEVKAHAQVPFTVKVKSDRGLKNAIKLIDALIEEKAIEKKTRFTESNVVEELQAKVAQKAE